LKLDEAWADKSGGAKLKHSDAIALLKRKLDLSPVKNTSLVEIRGKSDKPEEAARIANAVAEAYRDYRREQKLRVTQDAIKALNDRYAEQDQKVKEAQKEVERLQRQVSVEGDAPLIRKVATNAPIPQPEVQTSDNAFSTFSLNVSDVAFKLGAASLEKGQMPDAASVRSEEFINAFDYRDPEPPPGVPVAFAWERARYPFAHNRDLLRFSIKTGAAGRQAGRPLSLVLLLDNSGSMERADRVQIIREALRVLAGQLQPQDKLSVITFARTARLWVDGISGSKAGEVFEQVGGLTPQGGTNLEEAMRLAYATALRHYLAGGINRVVVLTDGAANLGNVDPDALKQSVETHRKQGIALDCFGIGWEGFNDDLLEVLSRNGDGRYGFINSPEEAADEFAGQLAGALKVAASDVKVQVEFNPARVTAYRQIGYAKHQLTKEQFRDNTVDAAEIAAQEAGNALYAVEVNPAGSGPLCTVRCRFKIPGTTDYREHAWEVPFTGNAVSLDQASPAMRLAATASAFSEWLVASPFAAEVTPDRLLGYLSGVPEVYGPDARPKKLEWMIRQAKSIGGK
jgi:Mg-chelatase subunit ChlD